MLALTYTRGLRERLSAGEQLPVVAFPAAAIRSAAIRSAACPVVALAYLVVVAVAAVKWLDERLAVEPLGAATGVVQSVRTWDTSWLSRICGQFNSE